MAVKEPMSARGYEDRTTVAVKRVLLEIGQFLGSLQGNSGKLPRLLSCTPSASVIRYGLLVPRDFRFGYPVFRFLLLLRHPWFGS